MDQELDTLRSALAEISSGDEGSSRARALEIARLCDSIARVQLAQEKLVMLQGSSNKLRREVERILREVGLGEL
ncbi:MAG TPA: hypothetical protein VM409_03170 [Chloroflexia bacterium]|nr:hypothetical protein [Chloroflexia bacterium]